MSSIEVSLNKVKKIISTPLTRIKSNLNYFIALFKKTARKDLEMMGKKTNKKDEKY
jgi:hypothetical protein